ncbi:MAG: TMEM43 family protein [Bacteroidaceae bacterium]|nr:TMEM43 family protein [Bacteroidaceae bacterium]MBO4841275.1 TMEM43 family protein [Bacteroidaceae bacterium]
MAYQEVKTTGYGTRVGSSFKGIFSGLILFCLATALLWWNEGRAVKTDKMLNDAEKACVEMENPNKKDASLEGELVCATALATTEDSLTDNQFGIGAKAIALKRRVEYYQWVEHAQEKREDKLGGKEVVTTTYTYSKEWTPQPVESAEFKDPAYQQKNMVLTTVEPEEVWAANVSFGAYKLNDGLINCISSNEPYDLAINEDMLKELDRNAKEAYERFYGRAKTAQEPEQPTAATDSVKAANDSIQAINDSIQAATDSLLANAGNKVALEYIHQAGNMLYYGRVPGSPEIGDVRVTWEVIVPAKVTIISQVDGDTFKPFKARNGKRFQTLVMGKKDAAEIFEAEHEANNMLTWILRIIGILLIIAGLRGILAIFETILKVVPFVANIFGFGVGIVCFVVGLVWSLIIIALAWLFYRPLIGIALLAIAGFLIWVFAFKGKEKLKQLTNKQ